MRDVHWSRILLSWNNGVRLLFPPINTADLADRERDQSFLAWIFPASCPFCLADDKVPVFPGW
jgi:hypothetical protein